ncbi:lipid-A-disaccharide synthase [Celerinatantimonas diazotrophica]|uniref:Lipid-A-disaccharide synthase n=1 Tax=Celerinatantimonas diazotrophica TaxID=412034 RepID=A0A4R1J9L0_9GAMM|nr:lipid-A-disaccharide synthase [Celerinatantimonas diazotrophica]TCK47296.1 lipid-A-disaccharide synthase [Celerinatantimonas diazotrophica]CAG9296069.1 Lipid-A-disaccharide synthase [Celerinatantimonas diazotrophica]
MVKPVSRSLTIALVAGEVSGDILGAGLIKELKNIYPDAHFCGIAGPKMQALGCEAFFEMDELAVMGIVEVLEKLPRILKVRRQLIKRLKALKPDVFIGIDAPDFNLRVEDRLHAEGIKTVHYVSPSVWAWKQKRVFKIKRACDLLLAFLPFEKAFYERFDVPCEFVGHTMADAIDLDIAKAPARQALGIHPQGPLLAILPGSRKAEIELLSVPFLQAVQNLSTKIDALEVIVPMVSSARRAQFESLLQSHPVSLPVHIIDGNARQAMAASDAILLASGTAALEAMLVNRPMVVGYKLKPFSYWIAKRLVKTDYISLPNLLAGEPLVKECIQDDCNADVLSAALLPLLIDDQSALQARFRQLHEQIRCQADYKAAMAIKRVIES